MSRLDDVLDGIQAIAETFVIYDVTRADRRSRDGWPAILAEQVASSWSRRCASSTGSRASSRTSQAVHDLEHEADGLSRAADRRASSARLAIRSRSSSGATCTRALEDTIDAAEDAAEVIERMNHKATSLDRGRDRRGRPTGSTRPSRPDP